MQRANDGVTVLDAALQSTLHFMGQVLQAAQHAPDDFYVQLIASCPPNADPSTATAPARWLHAHLEPMHRPLPVRVGALDDLALPTVLDDTIDATRWRYGDGFWLSANHMTCCSCACR